MARLENAVSVNGNLKGEQLVNAIIKDAETCASKNIAFDELDDLFKSLEKANVNNIVQCVDYALHSCKFTLTILSVEPFEIVYSLFGNKVIRNKLNAAGVDEKSFIKKYFVTDCEPEPEVVTATQSVLELPVNAETAITPAIVNEILDWIFTNDYFANVLSQVGITKDKFKHLDKLNFEDVVSLVQKVGPLATEENIVKFLDEIVTYLFEIDKFSKLMQSINITKEWAMSEIKAAMHDVFTKEQSTDAIVVGNTEETNKTNHVEVINPNGKIAAVVDMNNNSKKSNKKNKKNKAVNNKVAQPAFNHTPRQTSDLDKRKAKLLSIVKFSKDRTEVSQMQFNGLYRSLTAQNFQGMIHNNVNQVKHTPDGPYLWEVKNHPMFNKAQYDFCFGGDSNISNTRLLILVNSISQTILVNAIPAQDVPNPEC